MHVGQAKRARRRLDQADMTYLIEVKPMRPAVTKKAEPAAKMDVATPG